MLFGLLLLVTRRLPQLYVTVYCLDLGFHKKPVRLVTDSSGASLFHFSYEEREVMQDQELVLPLELCQNQGEDSGPSHHDPNDRSMRESSGSGTRQRAVVE